MIETRRPESTLRSRPVVTAFARRAVLGLSALSLAGCGFLSNLQARPDPTRFFVLAPSATTTPVGTLDPTKTVGLGPIELPNYLQRPELIVRESTTEIRPSSFDRWSEPLDKGVARVLAQNLSTALGIDRVTLFPWYSNQEPSFQVRVDFLAFEPVGAREARVTARWEARRLGSGGDRIQRESTISKPIASDDTAQSVAALSAALDDLARDLASAVLSLAAAPVPAPATPTDSARPR